NHMAPAAMITVVGEHVFPFLRTLGGEGSTYATHMRDAELLSRVVDGFLRDVQAAHSPMVASSSWSVWSSLLSAGRGHDYSEEKVVPDVSELEHPDDDECGPGTRQDHPIERGDHARPVNASRFDEVGRQARRVVARHVRRRTLDDGDQPKLHA
ncbi:MAG: hypothetical protein GEU93_18445, partial [Propionibacteriales bacterium]|nr:hypothetical protein [Propionibacteriales bacterium]